MRLKLFKKLEKFSFYEKLLAWYDKNVLSENGEVLPSSKNALMTWYNMVAKISFTLRHMQKRVAFQNGSLSVYSEKVKIFSSLLTLRFLSDYSCLWNLFSYKWN